MTYKEKIPEGGIFGDVTITGGAVNEKNVCFVVCHTLSDFKRFVSGFLIRCSQSLFERFTFALLVFSDIWSSR